MTIHAAVGATAPSALVSAGGSPVLGPRELLHFGQPDIAAGDNATPALATPIQAPFCGAAITTGVTMLRPGSLTGLSVSLTNSVDGSNAIFGVYKNGVLFNAATIVTLTVIAEESKGYTTFAAGTYPFVAGDVVDVRVRTGSGWIATTVDAAIVVEIETLT